MLPGVVVGRGVPPLGQFPRHQKRSLTIYGNSIPVGVGYMAVSSADIAQSGMTGRGFLVSHCWGDSLWEAFGRLPQPFAPMFPEATDPATPSASPTPAEAALQLPSGSLPQPFAPESTTTPSTSPTPAEQQSAQESQDHPISFSPERLQQQQPQEDRLISYSPEQLQQQREPQPQESQDPPISFSQQLSHSEALIARAPSAPQEHAKPADETNSADAEEEAPQVGEEGVDSETSSEGEGEAKQGGPVLEEWTVAMLKAELQKRQISSAGTKAALLKRLKQAFEQDDKSAKESKARQGGEKGVIYSDEEVLDGLVDALQTIQSEEFPLLATKFYSQFVLPRMPSLQLKHNSWKKSAVLIQALVTDGLLQGLASSTFGTMCS